MNEYQRAAFIFAARQWIDTPFHHGARKIGQGVDCAQLVVAAALQAGILKTEPTELVFGPGLLLPRKMRRILEKYLFEVSDPVPGDVYWINTRRNLPLHLAIVTDRGILHASEDAGRVVETVLPRELVIAAVWRFYGG